MRIGIDLGGTKIEIIALGAAGEEIARERMPTPAGDYDKTLEVICHMVARIEARAGRQGRIGVGIPGAVSPASGLVKNANSVWLIGRPFDRDLGALLHRPVRIANDANCFALSEAVDGAAAGAGVVFGVILGTGVGGGVVVQGRVVQGRHAIAGEWGHNPLPWPQPDELPGPKCYCGRRGCVETFVSGPALAREYSHATGDALAPAEIAGRAASGDGAAERVLAAYENRLARALATVINIVDPDAIVLGGGMSNVARLYANVPSLWCEFVFSDRADTPLLPPQHGDSSGVRGAAWLWPAESGEV